MKLHLAIFMVSGLLSASVNEPLQTNIKSNELNKASQERIDTVSNTEQDAFIEYKELLEEIQTLKTYNAQLKQIITSQEDEVQSINEQIVEIEVTSQRIMPLMQKMIEGFESFVSLDIPFLQKERLNRTEMLSTLLANAKLTVSQKYRTIMEAYGVELEFARTIESFKAPLGDKQSVNFLRIGRTGLYYLSRDESEVGIYNPNTQAFETLDSDYIKEIKKGMKIAQKQLAPDLLSLPVFRTNFSLEGMN